jgi:hypothetical protein
MKKTLLFFSVSLTLAIGFFSSCTKEIIEKTVEIRYRDTIVYRMDTVRINSGDIVVAGKDSMIMDFAYTVEYAKDSSWVSVYFVDNSRNLPSDTKYSFFCQTNHNASGKDSHYGEFRFEGAGRQGIITEYISIPSTNKTFRISKVF